MGEKNCPKNRLDVNTPDAFALFWSDTFERNHAFVLTNKSPKAIPINAVL